MAMLKKILVGIVPEINESEVIRSHKHIWSALTDPPATATRWPAWGEVTDKPLVFAPDTHTHLKADITDFAHTHIGADITGLTANRALGTNGSGNIVVSSVTTTELFYLLGVTSNVQTQLDARLPLIGGTLTGVLNLNANLNYSNLHPTDGSEADSLSSMPFSSYALLKGIMANRTWFHPVGNISVEVDNGAGWVDAGWTDAQKKLLVMGDAGNSTGVMPNGCVGFRITLSADSYVYVSDLYMYLSTQSNNLKVNIYRKDFATQNWILVQAGTEVVNGWPTHYHTHHSTIPWHPSTHSDAVRVELVPNNGTWSNGNAVPIYRLQWWGAYPASRQELYGWDSDKNATFPAGLAATSFTEGGTALASKYAALSHAHDYLPLAGGTMTGTLTNDRGTGSVGVDLRTTSGIAPAVRWGDTLGTSWFFARADSSTLRIGSGWATDRLTLSSTGDLSFTGTLTGGTVPWARLSGVPSTFTPSSHTHGTADITDLSSYTGFDSRFVLVSSTGLGRVGNVSLNSVTDTAAEWANLPVGYSNMFSSSIGLAGGAPVNNYGYFTKVANRDSSGGWGGLWVGYTAGQNYVGRASTSAGFAGWDLLWSDANFSPSDYLPLTGGTLTGALALNTHELGSINNDSMYMRSSHASAVGMALRTNDNVARGYLYSTTDGIGFLSSAATWSWRVDNSGNLTVGTVPWARLSGVPAIGSGTVTSVTAGNGLNFTTISTTGAVTMGTPSTCGSASSNATTSTSHTHTIQINKNTDLTVGVTNRTTTGTFTLVTSHRNHTIHYTGAGAMTYNLVDSSFDIGSQVQLLNRGTGSITIARSTGVTNLYWMRGNNATPANANRTLGISGVATIIKLATGTWAVYGAGLS